MSATGRNIVKLVSGSAIGAAIGAVLARGAESTAKPDDPLMAAQMKVEDAGEKGPSITETGKAKVTDIRESLRDRWQRAQTAGDEAKTAREAELRAYFREKVDDPTAFPPEAPTRPDR